LIQIPQNLSKEEIRQVFKYICPRSDLSNLITDKTDFVKEQLLKFDEIEFHPSHKIGIVYCGPDQRTEEEMLANSISASRL
jgi:hypothetical protein